MFKKTLLSTFLTISSLATAHINLDLNLTIKNQGAERHLEQTFIVEENAITPLVFKDLDSLIVGVNTQTEDETVTIQAQFFQTTENDNFEAATELFTVETKFNEPQTITINDVDNDGSVVLVITPSLQK